MQLSERTKLSSLYAGTSLLFTVVRHRISGYGYAWNSIEQFLGSWLVHGLGLIILAIVTGATIAKYRGLVLDNAGGKPSMEELEFHVIVATLVATLAALVISYWPISDDLGLD